jgi:hypothetical protein
MGGLSTVFELHHGNGLSIQIRHRIVELDLCELYLIVCAEINGEVSLINGDTGRCAIGKIEVIEPDLERVKHLFVSIF